MMDIKVYGTATSGHQMVSAVISALLRKARIPFKMHEVTDVSTFLSRGIDSVPAVQMNDDPIIGLKSNESFSTSLRAVVNQILATENYGELPKFVIPIDFSDASMEALAYGHRLATDLGTVTQVLHAYRPEPKLDEQSEISFLSEAAAKERLDQIVESMDQDFGGDILQASLISGYLRAGFPGDKILELAKSSAAELIIMGTTGRGASPLSWLGSVSSAVVAESGASVLLVPASAHYRGVPSLVVGIDREPLSLAMVQTLASLCAPFKTTLHLVHVGGKEGQPALTSTATLLSRYYDQGFIKTEIIDHSDVLLALNEYATKHQLDMMAIVPTVKHSFQQLFKERITRQMIKQVTLPLLVLK